MKRYPFWKSLLVFVFGVCVLGSACTDKKPTVEKVNEDDLDKTPVVARVGEGAVTIQEFKDYLFDRATDYRRGMTDEVAEKLLEELVLEEALYQEALRLELDQDPRVKRRIRQMLTQNLMEQYVNRRVFSSDISENELRTYYDEHKEEFNRPEQVRLAYIYVGIPADGDDKKRVELKKRAEGALAKALSLQGRRSGFSQLIQEYSDRHAAIPMGDTGFFDRNGAPVGVPSQLVVAGFKLKNNGDLPDEVVETPDGFYVVMLIGRRAAVEKDIETVAPQLKRRIAQEKMKRMREKYLQDVKEKAGVSVDENVLQEIVAQMASPAVVSRSSGGQSLYAPPPPPGE